MKTEADEPAPPDLEGAGTESAPEDGQQPKRPHARAIRRIQECVVILLLAVVIAFVARVFVFQVYFVPSGSMIPAIQVGDRIVVDKLFFHPSGLHEGNIVVFATPPAAMKACDTTEKDLVKRVIGLPGQTISSSNGFVMINGQRLAESYLPSIDPLGTPIRKQKIPAGQYFVMGDNRAFSCDSRYFGPIKGSSMVGRVVATIWRNGHPDVVLF